MAVALALGSEACAAHYREIVVGLSGGRDSVALLHALEHSVHSKKLRAVHIHHGLSAHADDWAAFCERFCKTLGVALDVIRVEVKTGARVSVEAAARTSRYDALKSACSDSSLVALAHHADDQIETFLLQLLRGAGPRGLAAMPAYAPARAALPALWRPLLSVTRKNIEAYIAVHRLSHIEDDSNRNSRFKRNAVRLEVLPAIEKHFPDYRTALTRSIALQQAALELSNEITQSAAQTGSISIGIFRECSESQSIERFRRWLNHNSLPLPPATRTREAVRQLREITTDQYFRVQLGLGWELGVKQQRLVARKTGDETKKPAAHEQ